MVLRKRESRSPPVFFQSPITKVVGDFFCHWLSRIYSNRLQKDLTFNFQTIKDQEEELSWWRMKTGPTEGIFFCFLFLIAWARYGNLKQRIRLKTTVSKHQTLYFFRFWLSSFLFILCSLLHLLISLFYVWKKHHPERFLPRKRKVAFHRGNLEKMYSSESAFCFYFTQMSAIF